MKNYRDLEIYSPAYIEAYDELGSKINRFVDYAEKKWKVDK
jgi:hypothetical protein